MNLHGKIFALMSVADKTNIIDLAKCFVKNNIHIISTGGTAKKLRENHIPLVPIQTITRNPECLDGRMKSISFPVASGILFDRNNPDHCQTIEELYFPDIRFVVGNFYPFEKVIETPDCTLEKAIENIDVGGPTNVRAAAKNFMSGVTVITDPHHYELAIQLLNKYKEIPLHYRQALSYQAFAYTNQYDYKIQNYLKGFIEKEKVKQLKLLWDFHMQDSSEHFELWTKGKPLRYGENNFQEAKIVFPEEKTEEKSERKVDPLTFSKFLKINGKDLSYNNYLDCDSVLRSMVNLNQVFPDEPMCVIAKHTNPSGMAIGINATDAFKKAWYDGDTLASFGGIIGLNREIDLELANIMKSELKFFEVIMAPGITEEALESLKKRKKFRNELRILINTELKNPLPDPNIYEVKEIRGAKLIQEKDIKAVSRNDFNNMTGALPTENQIQDLLFAWVVCKSSKSNTIVVCKDKTLLASGVGQQDRKRCCELCITKGQNKDLNGAVAASDAFFPFADGPEILVNAGIKAIIQPGGSKRDQDTIDLCQKNNVALVFTGIRGFLH